MSGPDPFGGMPFFGDLAKMLGRQGPIAWDAARQIAHTIATDGESEPNVDPMARMQVEQLARVAELQVSAVSGIEPAHGTGITVVPVTRTQWVARALDEQRPRFERLARSLGDDSGEGGDAGEGGQHPATAAAELDPGDPESAGAWLGQLMGMLQPMTLGMAAGSMVGHLATRAFGQYDLPLPRPAGSEIVLQVGAIDAFAADWGLGVDDVRLWVCLHDVAHHAVLGIPHVGERMQDLIDRFMAGFRTDPGGLERALDDFDPGDPSGLEAVQRMFTDPEVLMGASASPAQDEVRPQLDALVAVVIGWVDHVMDRVGGGLVGSYPQVTEAMRRRRIETSPADRYVERLFGLNLTRDRVDLGAAFVDGVVERAGEDGLARLWERPEHLPTPAELEAPGLWLARIDLDPEPS